MKAHSRCTAAALALLAAACVAPAASWRQTVSPPAPGRAGAPERGAGPVPAVQARRPPPAPAGAASRAVATARGLVGERSIVVSGVDYGPGCAALVRASLEAAGRPLPPGVRDAAAIHALAASRDALKPLARAAPGDVVFLAERAGGPPEHVGILARVDGDGTAVVLHRTARGVMPLRLNASTAKREGGTEAARRGNDVLLLHGRAVPAGSLAAGAADLLRG